MKEIKAVIRPSKLLEVTQELHDMEGLPGVTVHEIKGFGKGRGNRGEGEAGSELVELVARVQLELVVADEMVDQVVDVIQRYAHTGNTGDGKIFVTTVDDVVKIRTNERGAGAI